MSNDELSNLYQRYVRAGNAREFTVIADLIQEDVTLNGRQHKRADVLAGLQAMADAMPDLTFFIEDLFTADERIAVRLRVTGTPIKKWLGLAPTGAAVDFTEFASYKVRDGRFAEMWFLLDIPAVAQQLGAN